MVATVLFVSSGYFAFASANTIVGDYTCNSTDVDKGNAFKCDFNIAKTGQTYGTKARCDDGTAYIGTGIYEEEKHLFALVFTNPQKPEETGINIADIHNNGSMTLVWAYLNKTTFGHIRCVKDT